MNYIIDRIEGDVAVVECEDNHLNVLVSDINGEPKEGDCLVKLENRFSVDIARTKARRAEIIALQSELR